MVTSLHDITVGQDIEFKRLLASAGMDGAMVEEVLRRHDLADIMVGALKEQLLSTYLIPLDEQLENIRRWNSAGIYDFTDEELAAVDVTPRFSEQSLRRVEVLVPIASDVISAVDPLWRIVVAQFEENWRNPDLEADPKHLRLHPLARSYERGIHRVTLDLAYCHEPETGRTGQQVRDSVKESGKRLAAIEVLAAAAHFSKWVRAMDGEKVPFVDILGFEFRYNLDDDSDEAWGELFPYLYCFCEGREVEFLIDSVGLTSSKYAAPLLVESEDSELVS